jgi:predicted metal-dependent hydrolase
MNSVTKSSDTSTPRPAIRPRAFPFPADPIPRRWLGGNGIATALVNGVNLLFPAGERFFIRSVRHFLPELSRLSADDEAELRAQVQGFFGQEGRHAQAHERVFTVLREQGYEIDGFLRLYERFSFQFLERIMPASLCLATTAAAEHFTAIMAENALRANLFAEGNQTMRELLLWHASEEIEHKAVAFDVLRRVRPSYPLRVAGMLMASTILGTFWFAAVLLLLAQDRAQGDLTLKVDQERNQAWRKAHGRQGVIKEVFLAGIAEYLQRDFHPNQRDNLDLAKQYLASVGLE